MTKVKAATQPGDILSVKDVMALLQCSKNTAYRLMRTIRNIRIGACIRVRRSDLEKVIDNGGI